MHLFYRVSRARKDPRETSAVPAMTSSIKFRSVPVQVISSLNVHLMVYSHRFARIVESETDKILRAWHLGLGFNFRGEKQLWFNLTILIPICRGTVAQSEEHPKGPNLVQLSWLTWVRILRETILLRHGIGVWKIRRKKIIQATPSVRQTQN